MINLKFIEIDTNPLKPKATVHASGRLGFNIEAINFMDLQSKKNFKVAVSDQDGVEVRNIYLIEDKSVTGTAKVSKAGDYYYLNVGNLFDDLELDYKNYTVIFDIKKELYNGSDLYVLKMRSLKKKNKKEDKKEV